jgi:hypothetical protein
MHYRFSAQQEMSKVNDCLQKLEEWTVVDDRDTESLSQQLLDWKLQGNCCQKQMINWELLRGNCCV